MAKISSICPRSYILFVNMSCRHYYHGCYSDVALSRHFTFSSCSGQALASETRKSVYLQTWCLEEPFDISSRNQILLSACFTVCQFWAWDIFWKIILWLILWIKIVEGPIPIVPTLWLWLNFKRFNLKCEFSYVLVFYLIYKSYY